MSFLGGACGMSRIHIESNEIVHVSLAVSGKGEEMHCGVVGM